MPKSIDRESLRGVVDAEARPCSGQPSWRAVGTDLMLDVGYRFLAFGFSAGLLGIGCFSYYRVKAWSHPAVVFSLFWFLMTFLPLVFVIEAPIRPWAVLYLTAAIAAFCAPSWFMDLSTARTMASQRSRDDDPRTTTGALLAIFIGLQLATVVCMVKNLNIQHISFEDIVSDPIWASYRYLSHRYAGRIIQNPYLTLGTIFNFMAAGLGGLLIGRASQLRNVLVFLIALTPALAWVFVYADKGGIFLSAAYFYGGIVVNRVRSSNLDLVNVRTLKVGAIAFAILLPVMAFAMLVRGVGKWTPEQSLDMVLFYFRSYAFGHIYAFSDWFSHAFSSSSLFSYTDPGRLTWGFWTFMAFGKHLMPGYVVPSGYFNEYFRIEGVIQTNIYTMFRGLIYDFGPVGSLIFMAAAGWVSSVLYKRMLVTKAPPLAEAFYIFLAGYIYTSFLISLTTWKTPIVAAAGVAAVLWFDRFLAGEMRIAVAHTGKIVSEPKN
jgi:oligosaccharide repeat unit polymerase